MAYKLKYDVGFTSEKTEYEPGESVKVVFLCVGSDTSYTFHVNADDVKEEYAGDVIVIRFTMPDHDVDVSVTMGNPMKPNSASGLGIAGLEITGPGMAGAGMPGMGMPGMVTGAHPYGINGMGEHTDNSDPNAPKEIISKKIVEIECHFCVYNWLLTMKNEFIDFSVRNETDGSRLILSQTATGETVETDESFMERLQEVIEKNGLTKLNGRCEYTRGLPPEYQSYWMKALYDSGEELSFTIAGNPAYPWCLDLRKALCDELVRHGIEDMLPPKADRKVARFLLEIHKWPLLIRYWTIRTDEAPDEKVVHYLRSVWNKSTAESEAYEIIVVPDGFYEHITELVEQTKLRDYCNGLIDFPDGRKSDQVREPVIHYCAEGESGRQFNAFPIGDEIPEGLYKATDVIREYIDSVFKLFSLASK